MNNMSEDNKIEYKILLLGDNNVGRKSLFKKILTEEFSEKNVSTIGMDRRIIQLDVDIQENQTTITKSFDISIVLTSGQERFKSITKTTFKGFDCIIIIYDVTNLKSFGNFSGWIDSIHDSSDEDSKCLIIVLGTKTDLIGVDEREREVEEDYAKSFCERNKIVWGGECSAKTFSADEMKELLKGFVKQIYAEVGVRIKKEIIPKKISLKKEERKCLIF